MIDALNWIFPSTSSIGVWCFWFAGGFLYSFFVNHQDLETKRSNAWKFALAATAFMTAEAIAQIQNGEPDRPLHTIMLGVFVWILLELADWSCYGLHLLHFHPGGLQGWFWASLASRSERAANTARRRYLESIDPAERKALGLLGAQIDYPVHATPVRKTKAAKP